MTPLVKKRSKPGLVAPALVDVAGRMPRVDRRAVGRRLGLGRLVPHEIAKVVLGAERPEHDLVNGETDAVATIRGQAWVAGLGGLVHLDPHEARGPGRGRQPVCRDPAGRLLDVAGRKVAPPAGGRLLDGLFAGPVLDLVAPREGRRPRDPDRVHLARLTEVNDDPLGKVAIALPRERAREVRVALPVRARVAVGQSRVSFILRALVAGEPAPGQRVPERMADRLAEIRRTGEISAAAVAPGASRVPVPGLDVELRVQPVTDFSPAGGENRAATRAANTGRRPIPSPAGRWMRRGPRWGGTCSRPPGRHVDPDGGMRRPVTAAGAVPGARRSTARGLSQEATAATRERSSARRQRFMSRRAAK